MRGTLFLAGVDGDDLGIIPAYAGNTLILLAAGECSGDHPRVCGEHAAAFGTKEINPGSSPRMRGTPPVTGWPWSMRGTPEKKERLLESEGIIPAYAENTSGNGITTNFLRDHPRVCGEHATVDVTPTDNTGSSPRMRGTHAFTSPLV